MADYLQWKGWSEESFGFCSQAESDLFRFELAATGLSGSTNVRVWEIGFGNGSFGSFSMERGWAYFGTEIEPALVSRARAKGWDCFQSPPVVRAAGEDLDLVVAWDVLEHMTVEQIEAALETCFRSLVPGGSMVLRVPCGDSPLVGSIFFGDTTHRTLLASGAMRNLAEAAGFAVVEVRGSRPPVRGGSLTSAVRRRLLGMLRDSLAIALQFLVGTRSKLIADPNMVVTLVKPVIPEARAET